MIDIYATPYAISVLNRTVHMAHYPLLFVNNRQELEVLDVPNVGNKIIHLPEGTEATYSISPSTFADAYTEHPPIESEVVDDRRVYVVNGERFLSFYVASGIALATRLSYTIKSTITRSSELYVHSDDYFVWRVTEHECDAVEISALRERALVARSRFLQPVGVAAFSPGSRAR